MALGHHVEVALVLLGGFPLDPVDDAPGIG